MRKGMAILMAALLAGLVLAGPAVAQQVDETPYNDYPPRWTGYVLHPVGVALDLGLVKPMTFGVCIMPWLFGLSPQECPLEQTTPFDD
ncbi:MAG: hypothetical protein L0214_03770 [candidate division NC10 bacterium]|nr:hypothetical protein [candidate division NC10 bacterium]